MGKIDLNKLKKLHEELTNKNKGNKENFEDIYIQLQDGNNYVRILPAKEGLDTNDFFSMSYIHRLEYSEDGEKKAYNYHCLKSHDETCPVCEVYYALWQAINDGAEDADIYKSMARKLKGRKRFYLNAIQRADATDTTAGKPKILSIGEKLFAKITGAMMEDFPDLLDLELGNDMRINKTINKSGNEAFPNYDESGVRPKSTPVSTIKQQISEAMDQLHDLAALVKKEDYEKGKELVDKVIPGISEIIFGAPKVENKEEGTYLDKLKS